MRAFGCVSMLLLAVACSDGGGLTPDDGAVRPDVPDTAADVPAETEVETDAEAGPDAPSDEGLGPDGFEDAADDAAAGDAPGDGEDDAPLPPFVPAALVAERITSSPAGVATPPTWNAHLPKLVDDGEDLYAAHTYFPDDVASRYAAILRRPVTGPPGAWTEAARISYPHQPPGLVLDTARRLHLVFDCLRPGSVDVTCFPGGAGTGGLGSRFYHLIFSARDAGGALRFDTYANHGEWTTQSNGYHGLGTTADGVTWWSLADESWGRVVQWWSGPASFGTSAALARPGVYLLYPIQAADPVGGSGELLLYAGEFDPAGGTMAGYPASTAYRGSTAGFTELFRRVPTEPPAPGTVGAYPSDVAFASDGTAYVLSYRVEPGGACTELLRFDTGFAAPFTAWPVGCVDNYAKLQVSSRGVLYLLSSGSGAAVRLGTSVDRGASWVWHDVPIEGLAGAEDVRFFGYTPVKPYTVPGRYDPDRLVVFFSGYDAAGLARHSYYGTLVLAE
jgi:hypothetical protein